MDVVFLEPCATTLHDYLMMLEIVRHFVDQELSIGEWTAYDQDVVLPPRDSGDAALLQIAKSRNLTWRALGLMEPMTMEEAVSVHLGRDGVKSSQVVIDIVNKVICAQVMIHSLYVKGI